MVEQGAIRPLPREPHWAAPVSAGTRIGHIHLKVSDIGRALDFYCGVLGLELMQRYGSEAAFVAAGGYHHHIGLNTWQSRGAPPPPTRSTGLFHTAILYPSRASLADALLRLDAAKIPLEGASDHGVSEALYLSDPDRNGVELYRDRPPAEWPRDAKGHLAMVTQSLDLHALRHDASVQGRSALA
jgi:catechol 2,3-dioxygenase